MQLERLKLSIQREDLDSAIAHSTESILLPPLSWPQHARQHGSLILVSLYCLATALFLRSEVSKQPEDVISATKFLIHLRDQPHEIPIIPRHQVTRFLIKALALQVGLEAGNVMQNIREIAILSRELLTLETSDIDTTRLINLIHGVVESKICPGVPNQPLDELIEFLQAARKHRPDLHRGRFAFAICLVSRYCMTFVHDDYEEAASILDEIITYSSSGSTQLEGEDVAKTRGLATGLVTGLAMMQATTYQTPENLEEALYRARTVSSSSYLKEHFPSFVLDPEATAEQRFHHFGSIEGVELSGKSPFSLPVISENNRTVNDKMKSLLFGICNCDDTTMIDEAIEKGRSILASESSNAPSILRLLFSFNLDEAFVRTNKIEHINESISIRRQLIETSTSHSKRFPIFLSLSASLLYRFMFFPGYCTQDLDEALGILSQCASTSHVNLPNRFQLACGWAFFARDTRHSSVSTAYESALSLMQDTLLFSPTLQLQHTTLATDDKTRSLPLDYASYQLDHHQLEEAIESLERGRSLLWSELRHLRVPIDQLLEACPDLGHKFAAVNRDLEELTKSIPPSHKLGMDDGATDDLRAVDQFGRLLLKQRGLLKERNKLISQIQALPAFDSFLASPSFDTLRSSASSGPVIIINHSEWRSDILILLHNMPPSLIPTPDYFFERSCALKNKLLDSRQKYGLDSNNYDEVLASVLAELYTLVGQPLIDRFHQLQVPEQSRIWWCPTSVFASLPLHAMGPIPSDDGEPRYFLDLYICSYTPTLSALIHSRPCGFGSRSSDRPSVLLVAQSDPSLPTVKGEIQAVQPLDTEVTSLVTEAATPATVIDSFHRHRFVHFACHGTLEAGKPFEAGFELYGGQRLTLLEIVRSHLPTAEFAFLSACHTAEITEGSVMDEGLHQAAAVQYCGFRSVVGTMWAMVDEDGQELAENFYKVLFSNSRRDQGIPYHERSAKALRYAVKKLRRKRWITLERWVNFVHYGA
jgi:hypothetical protein